MFIQECFILVQLEIVAIEDFHGAIHSRHFDMDMQQTHSCTYIRSSRKLKIIGDVGEGFKIVGEGKGKGVEGILREKKTLVSEQISNIGTRNLNIDARKTLS